MSDRLEEILKPIINLVEDFRSHHDPDDLYMALTTETERAKQALQSYIDTKIIEAKQATIALFKEIVESSSQAYSFDGEAPVSICPTKALLDKLGGLDKPSDTASVGGNQVADPILVSELFKMVYQWGKFGVVVDSSAPAFQEQLKEVIGSL